MGRSNDGAEWGRRYKVTCFGENIGAFILPVGKHMENPEALMRPVVTRPYKVDHGDTMYYWAEPDPEGGFITVYWQPDLVEESEEAERFYAAAHGLNPDGSVDQERQAPLAGRTVEETQLIRAVLANPEAEEPYLAYAEWLARKSDPYAEYIRLSLQMEPLMEDDEHRERLDERRDDLVEKHGPKWIRALTDLGLFPGNDWEDPEDFDPGWWFDDKGVIEQLAIPGGTFVFRKNPARLFAAAPFLRLLTVSDPEVTVADLAAIPQMAQIDWLYLSIGVGTEDDYKRFASSPYFEGLRWLTMIGYGFGPDVAGMIASARWMGNLRGLDISSNALGDDGAEAFAESPQSANLEEFELNNNELTDRGLMALCRSPHLARIKTLEVANNAFTAEGIRALATATFAANLEYLDVPGCGLDSAALAVLAAATFPALKVLDVSEHRVGDGVMRAFVAASYFRTLEVFWADGCDLGNGILNAIAGSGFIALQDLALGDNQIDDVGVETLLTSKAVRKVKVLNLARNPFGTDGVFALADAELPALEELDLTGIRLGKEAVQALGKAAWRKQLTRLDISDEEVSERAQEYLQERFGEDVVNVYD